MVKPQRWSAQHARPSGCVITLLFAAASLAGLGRMFAEVLT